MLHSIYGITTVAYLGISLLRSLWVLFHGWLQTIWTWMNITYNNANRSVRCQNKECEPSIQINHAYLLWLFEIYGKSQSLWGNWKQRNFKIQLRFQLPWKCGNKFWHGTLNNNKISFEFKYNGDEPRYCK